MCAACAGRLEVARYLVEEVEVDIFRKNQKGKDAYDIAQMYSQENLVEFLERLMTDQLEMRAKANLLLLRRHKEPHISRIPNGLFKQLMEYF